MKICRERRLGICLLKKNLIFDIFDLHNLPLDTLKDFSNIHLALERDYYKLFIKLFPIFDRDQKGEISKLIDVAVRRGNYLILRSLLYPYIPKKNRNKCLKEALNHTRSEYLGKEFVAFCALNKMNSDVRDEIFKLRPQMSRWINFADKHWKTESKIDVLNFLFKSRPGEPLELFSYDKWGWVSAVDFLRILFALDIPIGSLKCSVEGTALSSLVNNRCLGSNRCSGQDDLIHALIKRGLGVNEDTPIGKPLNHYLYMLSFHITRVDLTKDQRNRSLDVVVSFLKAYKKVDSAICMSLNSALAEELHGGATGSKMEEYMQTALGSTLLFDCASKELYDLVKWTVDLEEVNGHRRNFVHHLAFLETCLEDHCERLFLERNYSVKEMKVHINLQDGDGMTPLMYATRNPGFFRQLLACGADISLTDKRGFSVAHHLMIHGRDEVIKNFLEKNHIPFLKDDTGPVLKQKLGISMEDCVTLGVTFFDQLMELNHPSKILVGHRKSPTYHLDILSTHLQMALRIKEGLAVLIEDADLYRDMSCLKAVLKSQREEEDQKKRMFLSTGTGSYLYDGPAFVTETYVLSDPFHVCEAYGRYAPDFSYPLRSWSVLLDGFKRMFTQALKRTYGDGERGLEEFRKQLLVHREILLMSQEYLVPLMIDQMCEGEENLDSFFQLILDFFEDEEGELKAHVRKILTVMISCYSPIEERLLEMVPFIKEDERGVYFPFCYLLPPKEAFILENLLLKELGKLPALQSDFKNGVYRNMQALMRTAMRDHIGHYLGKLRAHERKVLNKRVELESHPRVVSSFKNVLALLSPPHEGLYTEDELRERVRVNGRSVSFVIDDEEYIIKVRKKDEDMRDHAEIACGLVEGERDIQDHYGVVVYGILDEDIADIVHSFILDKSKNPRISLTASCLTENAVLFKVKHTHYFEYLSGRCIPFKNFKDGLIRMMEQALRQMKEQGRFMETLSDIAHDESRPGIFLPMVYFLDYVNGIFLGTFLKIIDSFKTVDACEAGLRDLGNALRCLIKKNMAFSKTYRTYLTNFYEKMTKDGEDTEFDEMILINNMQEAVAHTLMTASMLLLIRLSDNFEELNEMTSEQFIADLEDVLIKPFIRICGLKDDVDSLRPFYEEMLKKDFEDFKANPHHFEYTASFFRHGDLSRNNYYQSFYILTFFLMSLMVPQDENMDSEESMTKDSAVFFRGENFMETLEGKYEDETRRIGMKRWRRDENMVGVMIDMKRMRLNSQRFIISGSRSA